MFNKSSVFSLLILIFLLTAGSGEINAQTVSTKYFKEKFAVQSLLKISAAEATYSATSNNARYGSLTELRQANLIDDILASGEKYGYSFVISTTESAGFYATATPQLYRRISRNSFYIDQTGDMRGADKNGAAATVSDTPVDACVRAGFSNEDCTIQDLRTLYAAEMTYQATIGNGEFGDFQALHNAGLIGIGLLNYRSHSYLFNIRITTKSASHNAYFEIIAYPQTYGSSGIRSFFVNLNGTVHGADKNGGRADETDPPI